MAELQARMTSAEFTEWLGFDLIDPIGEVRADLRNAMQMSLLANINRNPRKKREPFKVSDFMPDFDPQPQDKKVSRSLRQHLKQLAGKK